MTKQEVIEGLKSLLLAAEDEDGPELACWDKEAIENAIEMLEESEERKGKWIVRHRHEHYPSGSPYDEDVCPFCKRADHNGDGLYCGYCGAKMEAE